MPAIYSNRTAIRIFPRTIHLQSICSLHSIAVTSLSMAQPEIEYPENGFQPGDDEGDADSGEEMQVDVVQEGAIVPKPKRTISSKRTHVRGILDRCRNGDSGKRVPGAKCHSFITGYIATCKDQKGEQYNGVTLVSKDCDDALRAVIADFVHNIVVCAQRQSGHQYLVQQDIENAIQLMGKNGYYGIVADAMRTKTMPDEPVVVSRIGPRPTLDEIRVFVGTQ